MATASSLTLDPQNANLGTARGRALLAESLATCGYGRPLLADQHGTLIAGNKTLEAARAAGLEDVTIVTVGGNELVVVQRTDLDLLTDPKARQLAYYDNRVQQLDLLWSPAQLRLDVLAGVPLDVAFFPEELMEFGAIPPATAPEPLPRGEATHPADASEAFVDDTPAPGGELVWDATTDQATRWYEFLTRLAARYPDADTPAACLAAYLTETEAL
jgi:hypothetical protein